jgi:hypothetical protein
MAAQTTTQRQATAKQAAATRKRNAAKRSAYRTKVSARRTANSARSTSRAARGTAKQATRTTARRVEAEATRLEAVARQAERALHIPVGVALEARDTMVQTVRTYANRTRARRELNRFERRGATALRRNRRNLERQVKGVHRSVERRAGNFQS